jgi:hypothetical protein
MAFSNGTATTLQRFGFSSDRGGPHLARTMMLGDLDELLSEGRVDEPRQSLVDAIEWDNVLGKRSVQSRKLAAKYLTKLYVLDSDVPLYRAFAYLWRRDASGRPLMALLMAYVRDAVLRSSAPFILGMPPGDPFEREQLESFIDGLQPGRFSLSTLRSTVRNLAGTWTQSGHLCGHSKKERSLANPTPAAVALALLLGFVQGDRGQLLFESEFVKLLDCSATQGMELAESAASKGWINFKRVGSIMEVDFPRLLTEEEKGWIFEQG